jgi:translation initiation factor 2B subunit (eIF-2B alpha/beta/delta family)
MPTVSGYITVEVDVADYDSDVSIEFYDLEEVIDAAQDNNYTKEEIVDYCFDSGLNMIDYMRTSCDIPELIKLLDAVVSEKIASLKDIIENRNDLINNRGDKIKELEEQLKKLQEESDKEAVKNVAY